MAYLLTAPNAARAVLPEPVLVTPASLPAPQAPPEGYVAYVAGREGVPPGGAGRSRIEHATPIATAALPSTPAPSAPAVLSRPVEGAWDPDRAPQSPTAADEAVAVIAADTPEVAMPE